MPLFFSSQILSMTTYQSVSAILATSLREYLSASKFSLEFAKPSDWGSEAGHCLGFASALLLFSIVDAIGSYHRGSGASFAVEKKERQIDGADFRHFFVLNGDRYYGQDLSHAAIKELYDDYRSLLTHNASIASGQSLILDPHEAALFPIRDGSMAVNLHAFHNRSVVAVEVFLAKGMVETSQVVRNLKLRK
jgi:hypothetical protein